MKTYQAHDEHSVSVSNTIRKLARLRLPEKLPEWRVLDIGCNEGYFCNLARERGAAEVIGIDFVAENVEFAAQRYGRDGVRFLRQAWSVLPDGPFDLVLWTSAMHYELDPRAVLDEIFNRLAPDGLLVLECGVSMSPGREFIPVPRTADTRWYPSRELLVDKFLARFSVRQVAEPEIAEGDYIPRAVFHCRKALPLVVIVRGASGDGKSTLSDRLRHSATKLIGLDLLVSRMGTSRHPHDDLERFLVEHYDPTDLGALYLGLDCAKLTEKYADLLSKAVAATDDLVVFEGYMTDAQMEALVKRLRGKAIVWDTQRRLPPA